MMPSLQIMTEQTPQEEASMLRLHVRKTLEDVAVKSQIAASMPSSELISMLSQMARDLEYAEELDMGPPDVD